MTTSLRNILGARPLHGVDPAASLADAARQMAEARVGALAVLRDGALLGVLSERDIVWRGVAQGLDMTAATVAQVMTPDPVCVSIDDPVSDALAAKLGDAFRHLPVVDGDRVVGLLSFRDIPVQYVMMFERFREMAGAHADD